MSSKIDKKALKGPDAFVATSDKIGHWIEDHAPAVGLIIGLIVVLSLGWVGYGFYRSHAETQAAEALFGPEAELKQAETKVRDERAKKMQSLASLSEKEKAKAKPEMVRPVDFEKDFAPAVHQLEAEIKLNSGTKAALVSAMNLSYFLLQQKQYGEALTALNLAKFKPSASNLLGGFWFMHQGLVFLENNKFDEAMSAYQKVLGSQALKAFYPEALLKLGLTYEMKGQADKARETYEKLGREFPESEASSSAQQYLRLLDLKNQQG